MKAWMTGLLVLLLACAGDAMAQARADLEQATRASMLLSGLVELDSDGRVSAYTIDQADGLDPVILAHLARHLPHWQVEPVVRDGMPVATSARFTLRLVARRHEGDQFDFGISGVDIREDPPGRKGVKAVDMTPPRYPKDMVLRGGSGVVYLVARLRSDGKVADVHAEQVNLTVLAGGADADRIRRGLAKAALKAARDWRFQFPEGDPPAGGMHTLRIPVEFMLGEAAPSHMGRWILYLPGARTPAPWSQDEDGGGDAMNPRGGAMLVDGGLRLVTPLEPPGG